MHLKGAMTAIAICALNVRAIADADAVGYTETRPSSAQLLTRDMTDEDITRLIYNAMPFPILSILHGIEGDKRHFAVNMNIAALGKSKSVFHVAFHVPISADRSVIERAVHAAARYAIHSLKQLR